MDPLSVTASVVGLLAAAGQVASVLSKIKSTVSDAPSSIAQTLIHVNELQVCFSAVHKFLVRMSAAPRRRLSMIGVDQLIAILTESVLTFSKLEVLITPFSTCPQASMRDRMKWTWKEDVVSLITLRLDRHKSSLSLMLNIVQWYVFVLRDFSGFPFIILEDHSIDYISESDREAEQSQQSLLALVQQLIESNVEISRRLQALKTTFDTESILTA